MLSLDRPMVATGPAQARPYADLSAYKNYLRGTGRFIQTPRDDRGRELRDERGGVRRLAITGQTNLDTASTDYIALWSEGFRAPSVLVDRCVMRQATGTLNVNVPFVNASPAFRTWYGPKQFKSPRAFDQNVAISSYEASIDMPRLRVDGDKSGAVNSELSNFVAGGNLALEKLWVATIIANAITSYDGVALLATTHTFSSTIGSSSNGNNLTTSALSWSTYKTARLAMQSNLNEAGFPFTSAFQYVLVVGPKQEQIALEVTGAQRPVGISNAGAFDQTSNVVGVAAIENVFRGSADVIVTQFLTGNEWFLINVGSGNMRPFFQAEYRSPEPQMQTAMDGDGRFLHDLYRYSIEADLGLAAGPWWLIYGSVTN